MNDMPPLSDEKLPPLSDEELLTPVEPSRVMRKRRHSWFGGPEILGYVMFVLLLMFVYAALRPDVLPSIANSKTLEVLKDIRAVNPVQYNNGIVSADIYRNKVRDGEPLSVTFYIVNGLTAEGDKGIRVLPYHGDDKCNQLPDGDGKMFRHRIGPITTRYCFKLPPQVVPGQDYQVRGEMTHSAWPFYGLVPIVKKIPEFTPKHVAVWPYGALPTPPKRSELPWAPSPADFVLGKPAQ